MSEKGECIVKEDDLEINNQIIDENKGLNKSYSQWQLMWIKFKNHRLAVGSAIFLILIYLVAITCGFIAPYNPNQKYTNQIFAPPQLPHFIDEERNIQIRPFVYGLKQEVDPVTWKRTYKYDKSKKLPIYFFVRGSEYKLAGFFKTDIHLFGIGSKDPCYFLGSDELGRDMFSRIIFGTRVSMSIGLIGVFMSLILGLFIGSTSGLLAGSVDMIIQRIIVIIRSIPRIPLWMALTASLPKEWTGIQVYFAITILLSLVAWTGVARVVRGKILSLRNEDFVLAARTYGATIWWIIPKHLIPNFMSYVLVRMTLAIPGMILGETALSFLGIGLRPPIVSWGVLLQKAQNIRTVSSHPWLLLPGLFVVIVILSFNFVGDGLRDAADPYSR